MKITVLFLITYLFCNSMNSMDIVRKAVQQKYKNKTEQYIKNYLRKVDEMGNSVINDIPVKKHEIFMFVENALDQDFLLGPSVIGIAYQKRTNQVIFLDGNLEGLSKFIKEEGYQIGKNITTEAFIKLFIGSTPEDVRGSLIKSINQIDLYRDNDEKELKFIKEFKDRISPPQLKRNLNGTVLKFWTSSYSQLEICKWRIIISKDYKISYKLLLKKDMYGLMRPVM